MLWIVLAGLLILGAYTAFFLITETQCPYCRARYSKRLEYRESSSDTMLHVFFNVREVKNRYTCVNCDQDWWIEGDRELPLAPFFYGLLEAYTSDRTGRSFSYLFQRFVFGLEVVIGAVLGALLILIISLRFHDAPSVSLLTLFAGAVSGGVLALVATRILLYLGYRDQRSGTIVGGLMGGLLSPAISIFIASMAAA